MVDHQQIVPLVRITSTSPHSSPLVPPNTCPAISTSISPRSSNGGLDAKFAQLHAVIISLITMVGAYVLFQFQSMKLSLFDEHGNIMRAAFVILFLYVMGFMAEYRPQNQSNCFLDIMKQFTPLLGLFVVVLLLFIISLFLGFVASIIWALLVLGPVISLFQEIIQWLRDTFQQICTNLAGTNHYDVEETSGSIGTQDNDPPV